MKGAGFKVVGQSGPRHEALEKVTGRASYLDDLSIPGMVYGAVLRSPHPHARVLRIDFSNAMKIPGVLASLLPRDCPETLFNCAGDVPSPLSIRDERILTEEPRYVGDRIAAVAGLSPEICRAALDAVEVEYEPLPALLSLREALKETAPALHPEITPTNVFKKIEASEGDAEDALLHSDHVFEEEFHTPAVHHACLEPVGCICDYRREGDLTVWSTSQTVFQERRILSEILGLPENRIRIIKPFVGGGFGSRQQLHDQHVAALLSMRVGRPVKIVHTRPEEMTGTCVRHESICRLRVGVSADGMLQGFHARVYHNAGAYASHSPVVLAAQSRKLQYRCAHYKYEGHCVYTNTIVAGAWRGYGNPQITFAREVLFDRIARTLGMDPVAFRLKNHLGVGDRITASPIVLHSCAIAECVREGERLKREIDLKDGSREGEGGKGSWGVAFAMHTSGPSNNSGMSSSVILANDDGSVQLLSGSADIGQGSETTLSQIAAESLGISLKDVTVSPLDTLHSPYDTGTFASSQTYVGGQAVLEAAKELKG
jgi:CO/xanthine dehydrogenase Mo-binding subunit